ncbi:hypothetical protein BD769DRAFT_1670734 [Suillus cothurnatus]|nr:hypothetical protein BD769DRAFT_1670734 [Suillus cothurnatus]
MPSTSSPSPPPDDTAPGPNRMKAVLNSLENLQGGRKRKWTDALDPYLKAARAFPLLHDPFVDLGAVFYDGIRADHGEEVPDDNETPEELKDRQYRIDVFRNFIKRIPSISATLGSFEDDPAKLEDFINALKDLCPSFLLDDPMKPRAALDPPIVKGQSKSLRGWNHKDTARALCPMVDIKTFDEDPKAYMDSILNGERKPPSFKKLPSCLYDESLTDPRLKCSGFLRGKPLERTFHAIFTGPLTALEPTSRKGTKHPKGVIHGMTEPSPPAIAYAAVQLIISLSSAEQWTSEVTGLDLYELFMSLIDSLKRTDHPWVKETLDYWKRVAPRLTQTSRRKSGRRTTAASDDSDSDDMEGFLDEPSPQHPSSDRSNGGPSASQHSSSPPPERQRQPTPPPPPPERQRQRQLTPPPLPPPPPPEGQRQPTTPSPNHDEDDDDRLTPPPLTPAIRTPLVAKCKAPGTAKRGKAPRRKR